MREAADSLVTVCVHCCKGVVFWGQVHASPVVTADESDTLLRPCLSNLHSVCHSKKENAPIMIWFLMIVCAGGEL